MTSSSSSIYKTSITRLNLSFVIQIQLHFQRLHFATEFNHQRVEMGFKSENLVKSRADLFFFLLSVFTHDSECEAKIFLYTSIIGTHISFVYLKARTTECIHVYLA